MQSEVNQEENLNRIITVPNLLFFSALSAFKYSSCAHEHLKKEKAAMSFYDHSAKNVRFLNY